MLGYTRSVNIAEIVKRYVGLVFNVSLLDLIKIAAILRSGMFQNICSINMVFVPESQSKVQSFVNQSSHHYKILCFPLFQSRDKWSRKMIQNYDNFVYWYKITLHLLYLIAQLGKSLQEIDLIPGLRLR